MKYRKRHKNFLSNALACVVGITMVFSFIYGCSYYLVDFTANAAVLSALLTMPEGGVEYLKENFIGSSSSEPPPQVGQDSSSSSEPPVSSEPIRDNDTEHGNDEETSSDKPSSSDVTSIPANSGNILEEKFFSSSTGTQYLMFGKGCVRNYTKLSAQKVQEQLNKKSSLVLAKTDKPQVLIMHTHATESYQLTDSLYYDKTYNARTTDNSKNVVSVGDAIEKKLKDAGIGVVHDTTQHDYPSYNGSYDRSEVTVKNYLKKYPTIKVVLDIHRDAIERSGGVRVKPTTTINGKKAAQIMIISGCDNGKMGMPNWSDNLRFSAMLQDKVETLYPTLTRPIMLDYRNYNQHLTKASILIEMGGHANTLDEAIYSGELVGDALAKVLAPLMK